MAKAQGEDRKRVLVHKVGNFAEKEIGPGVLCHTFLELLYDMIFL